MKKRVKKLNNDKKHNLVTVYTMIKKLCREKGGKCYIIGKILLSIFDSVLSIVYLVIPGLIINELTTTRLYHKLLVLVGILLIAPIVNYVKNISLGTYLQQTKMSLIRRFNICFQDHIAEMEYETLEKPDVRVLKQRASVTAPAPIYMFDRLIPFLTAIITLIMMSTIIATLHPLIIVLILFVVIVNSIVTKKINDKNFENKKEISKYNNLYYTHFNDLSDTASAKEIRIYDLKEYFINLFTKEGETIDSLSMKDELYRKKMQAFHVLSGLLQQVILYAYLIYSVVQKGLAIGTMTIYLSTVSKISTALTTVFNQFLEIKRYCLDITEYMSFMSIPTSQEKSGRYTPVFDASSIIEFKNVSFKYPGCDHYALEKVNIKIYGNKKICIVGENGSGKTTFIKLITRLYEPCDGVITLNGMDIREYDIKEYRKIFAPVFQDYSLYNLSLIENITFSKKATAYDANDVIKKSGLLSLVEHTPKGYHTQIWKNIDPNGIEPSGGEGQKIAIARAIYKSAHLYLLDEPTASLDPNAEYDIYCKFNELINNKAAILITHRLSAVQLADEIYVFCGGRIVESGTHQELYLSKGIYTEMFDKQAQFYRDNPNKALS